MQTIYIDISNKGTIPRVFAKQGDVGRSFLAILSDNGIPYAPGDGSVVSVWYSGKSGEGNYTSIGESQAVRYEKNKIFVELITQMLSVAGDGIISLVLNDSSGQQIGFWNIDYTVEPVAGIESPEATQHFTMLSETAAKIMESVDRAEGLAKKFTIDKTLSVDGAAADAAAVGEALSKVSLGSADRVVEQGNSGIWNYRKWDSGRIELWTNEHPFTVSFSSASGLYYATQEKISVPLVKTIQYTGGGVTMWHYANWSSVTCNDNKLGIRYYGMNANGDGNTIPFSLYVIGTWK